MRRAALVSYQPLHRAGNGGGVSDSASSSSVSGALQNHEELRLRNGRLAGARRLHRWLMATFLAVLSLLMMFFGIESSQQQHVDKLIESQLQPATTLHKNGRATTENEANAPSGHGRPPLMSKQESAEPRRKWAYVFLLGGIDPAHPDNYVGALYNILIATYNLRHAPPVVPKTKQARLKNVSNTFSSSSNDTSVADIIVMVQFSIHCDTTPTSSKSKNPLMLPQDQVDLLHAMNVQIQYLPTPTNGVQNFYTVTLEKFQILALTDYSRVMFLDSDVMPFCSLDYLFDLSEPLVAANTDSHDNRKNPTQQETTQHGDDVHSNNKPFRRLQENVILAWKRAPAHAGIFILRPSKEGFAKIQSIIQQREREALQLPWPHFNETIGWGHLIDTRRGDYVDLYPKSGNRKRQRKQRQQERAAHVTTDTTMNDNDTDNSGIVPWNWYCAYSDQGLLYHWTKYVQQQVSIIVGEEVENWSSNNEIKKDPVLEGTWTDSPLSKYSCLPKGMAKRGMYGFTDSGFTPRSVPYRDMAHFTSASKPWEQSLASSMAKSVQGLGSVAEIQDATRYWFYILINRLQEEEQGLVHHPLLKNVHEMLQRTESKNPPVGRSVGYQQMIMAARARQG